ncbi:hypothetical protein B0T21DRAFT_349888 [Apiosordaria backusii]|uniref:Uncharacterized protein n=1 Tax=Apiosordaria backusii TaxID=314023 RepID=A0AA40E8F7_9PEZI|nr:hypothetical protein B0T21DRAFT_349888 [Apiosordaria backusii]
MYLVAISQTTMGSQISWKPCSMFILIIGQREPRRRYSTATENQGGASNFPLPPPPAPLLLRPSVTLCNLVPEAAYSGGPRQPRKLNARIWKHGTERSTARSFLKGNWDRCPRQAEVAFFEAKTGFRDSITNAFEKFKELHPGPIVQHSSTHMGKRRKLHQVYARSGILR